MKFAYFATNLGNGNFATNPSNDYISMQGWVKIKITLPSLSLIKAIWWSTSNKDSTNGVIVSIGKVKYQVVGSKNQTSTFLSSPNQTENPGITVTINF